MAGGQFPAGLWLMLVALIWGSTFVVVENELAGIGPMVLVARRPPRRLMPR